MILPYELIIIRFDSQFISENFDSQSVMIFLSPFDPPRP
jgi:hypothetical protein